ncbi:keratin-associated protein 5-8-like [Penaeus vannamei]|uniref:keratin-associated protein 5-8-like n=1 Tax=Penaeus vannamei TaxID=6689 RepID=UPI00387F5CC6
MKRFSIFLQLLAVTLTWYLVTSRKIDCAAVKCFGPPLVEGCTAKGSPGSCCPKWRCKPVCDDGTKCKPFTFPDCQPVFTNGTCCPSCRGYN